MTSLLRSEDLSAGLEAIRVQADLPALAGALFLNDGTIEEEAAVGFRKRGGTERATLGDAWHLGSDTKAMTATLLATYVAEGKLTWETPVFSFFPEWVAAAPAATRSITVGQLLSHYAGLDEYTAASELRQLLVPGTLMEQRQAAARIALTTAPYAPGSFRYSNADYIVAGAIIEKIGGKPWEESIWERLFKPLGMTSTSFDGAAFGNGPPQPWPHFEDGSPVPDDAPGLPSFIAPAGLVRAPIADWVRFLADQLRGAEGAPALLPPALYTAMQVPASGAEDGCGWASVERAWAGGHALTHDGSDGKNYAVCWLAPARGYGFVVCTNQGGEAAAKACDDAAVLLMRRHQARGGKS